MQVRQTGMHALNDLAERRSGIDYEQYGESLLDAAEAGSTAEIQRLLDAQADVEYSDDDGFSPMIFAACNGWPNAVQILIERQANPMFVTSDLMKYLVHCPT